MLTLAVVHINISITSGFNLMSSQLDSSPGGAPGHPYRSLSRFNLTVGFLVCLVSRMSHHDGRCSFVARRLHEI